MAAFMPENSMEIKPSNTIKDRDLSIEYMIRILDGCEEANAMDSI